MDREHSRDRNPGVLFCGIGNLLDYQQDYCKIKNAQ